MNKLERFKKAINEYLEGIPLNKCVVCGRPITAYNKVFCNEFCKELMLVMIFKKLNGIKDWRSSNGNKLSKI